MIDAFVAAAEASVGRRRPRPRSTRSSPRARSKSVVDDVLLPAAAALGDAWAAGRLERGGRARSERRRRPTAGGGVPGRRGQPDEGRLVGLPPGSRHELGALAFAVALRRRGVGVLYLGADVTGRRLGGRRTPNEGPGRRRRRRHRSRPGGGRRRRRRRCSSTTSPTVAIGGAGGRSRSDETTAVDVDARPRRRLPRATWPGRSSGTPPIRADHEPGAPETSGVKAPAPDRPPARPRVSHRRAGRAADSAGRRNAVERPRASVEDTGARSIARCRGASRATTMVSIPSAGVRSSGPMTRWKPGSDAAAPACPPSRGASRRMRPVRREPPRPFAHERDLGALRPRIGPRPGVGAGRGLEVVEGSVCVYIPPEVTAMTRDPGVARRSGNRPASSANGPATIRASVASIPSAALGARREDRAGVVDEDVEARLGRQDPIDGRRGPSRATPCRRRRPGSGRRPWSPRASARRGAASRASLRPTRTTRAPRSASAQVAREPEARGRPGHERRCGRRGHRARRPSTPNRRRRTAGPMRLKLPTTETSSVASTSRRQRVDGRR